MFPQEPKFARVLRASDGPQVCEMVVCLQSKSLLCTQPAMPAHQQVFYVITAAGSHASGGHSDVSFSNPSCPPEPDNGESDPAPESPKFPATRIKYGYGPRGAPDSPASEDAPIVIKHTRWPIGFESPFDHPTERRLIIDFILDDDKLNAFSAPQKPERSLKWFGE
jgi:hypothetical protein